MEPITRVGTLDRVIWADVCEKNEYRLNDDMSGQIVLDVGCHIGAFSAAVKNRGASEIFAVEMDLSNLTLAIENVSRQPGAATFQGYHAAAWRSDRRGDRLRNGGHDGKNTGGASSLPFHGLGVEVPTIPFDDVVKIASGGWRCGIDVVKFDCEGAEWPILFTSQNLDLIDAICGEYHVAHLAGFEPEQEVNGVTYSLDALRCLLVDEGFHVYIEPPNQSLYAHFWAWRHEGTFLPLG